MHENLNFDHEKLTVTWRFIIWRIQCVCVCVCVFEEKRWTCVVNNRLSFAGCKWQSSRGSSIGPALLTLWLCWRTSSSGWQPGHPPTGPQSERLTNQTGNVCMWYDHKIVPTSTFFSLYFEFDSIFFCLSFLLQPSAPPLPHRPEFWYFTVRKLH